MDMSLVFDSNGLTIFGIFLAGFVVGVIFWGLLRSVISKLIFFGIMVVVGLYLSGDPDIQRWVVKQLTSIEQAVDGFDDVVEAFPTSS